MQTKKHECSGGCWAGPREGHPESRWGAWWMGVILGFSLDSESVTPAVGGKLRQEGCRGFSSL